MMRKSAALHKLLDKRDVRRKDEFWRAIANSHKILIDIIKCITTDTIENTNKDQRQHIYFV